MRRPSSPLAASVSALALVMRGALVALALLALLASIALSLGCRPGPQTRAKVITTIFPVYDLARRAAGPDADVLLSTPADAATQAAGARLAVVIGLELDPWLTLTTARVAPTARVLRLADRVPTLTSPASAAAGDAVDPHVWLDPQRAVMMTRAIVDDLCRVDPGHAIAYRTRGLAVTQSIEALDSELRDRTARWTRREFSTPHDDFRYYADRYHLELLSSRDAAKAGRGAPEVPLDALGGAAGSDSYEALLRSSSDALEKALLTNGPGH